MTTTYQSNKAARGTKRTCHSCEARFYDLMRRPAVCPVCGIDQAFAQPTPVVERRGANVNKTAWRQNFTQQPPRPVEPDPEDALPLGEAEASSDASEAADAPAADDQVLEQEAEDGDLSELLDVEVDSGKEG
jgi:uncharacterized protein (TIGR02300 family)